MSEIWKIRIKKVLFWLTGAACGAGGAVGLRQPEQQLACAANSALSGDKSAPEQALDAAKGLFKK